MSLKICHWKLLKKTQFSCISWPNFDTLKYLFQWKKVAKEIFLQIPICIVFNIFCPRLPQFQSFQKSKYRSKVLHYNSFQFTLTSKKQAFPFPLIIFSMVFFIVWWSLQSSFDISKMDSLNNFFIFHFSADVSFTHVSTYIMNKK